MDIVTLKLDRRDVGRVLSLVRQRLKKLKKGIDKFGDDFDPELGGSMIEAYRAMSNIEEELRHGLEENSRSAGRDPA